MTVVLDYLKRLNRKERFLLLEEALGAGTFSLDRRFRDRLQDCLGSRLPKTGIPKDAFVAMDYHMDWIQMALHLAKELPGFLEDNGKRNEHVCHSRDKEGNYLFRANQQDVDLLIAFDNREETHIIMIEAKAETGWTNNQLNGKDGKINRLKAMFGEYNQERYPVIPHLILLSPKYSKRLKFQSWPDWAKTHSGSKYYWLKLPHPELIQVTRKEKADDVYCRLSIERKPANLLS